MESKTRNTLNAMQMARLYSYLEKDKDVTQGTTAEQLARQATTSLGFPVAASNINSMRSQMGLSPRDKVKPKTPKELAIQTLAREFVALNKELGRPTQPCLAELAK